MRETVIEKRFRIEIEKRGGKALKWVSHGNNGVPDRIVILPDGRTIYVELKAPGKPLEPLQEYWARKLRKMGHEVWKIDRHSDIDDFLREVMPK